MPGTFPYAMIQPAETARINPRPFIMLPLICEVVAAPVLLLFPFAFPPMALLTPKLEEAPLAEESAVVLESVGCTVMTVVSASSVLLEELSSLVELDGRDEDDEGDDDEEEEDDEPDVVLLLLPLLLPPEDEPLPESAVPSPPETSLPVPHGIFSPVG